jgi:hypothetical protein
MKKTVFSILVAAAACIAQAQPLQTFSLTVQPDVSKGKAFISIGKQAVYAESEAAANKSNIDFMYALSVSGQDTVKEFYSMSGKSSIVPEKMQGTQTGINAISWDKDEWNKCKTSADLKRMAGHITNNSFSFYAVVANNHTGSINYHCFIFQLANGKRGVLYVDKGNGNELKIIVKVEA